MRLSIRLPGYLYAEQTGELINDSAVLSSFDGWRYEVGSVYNYLDMELVDEGIVGGAIRTTWTPGCGLEIVVDYWAPDNLQPSVINKLRDATVDQLSEGIGEGGFETTYDGQDIVIVADTDHAPYVEQIDDGKPVPVPSTLARAARDGDCPLLENAIASGEPIDSQIQGYSALHLAIIYGHANAALLLISKGANVNQVVDDGDETPLHLVALSNSLSDRDSAVVTQALLDHGAEKTRTTTSGNTAASLAKDRGKKTMLNVLNEQ